MTYMIPIRRAIACVLPSASVAKTVFRKLRALARSAFFAASSVQSRAPPSLCSETLPAQLHNGSGTSVPAYVPSSQAASARVPGLAFGWQYC